MKRFQTSAAKAERVIQKEGAELLKLEKEKG
jgi:hypothetical protein